MKIIAGGRRCGKTTQMIECLRKNKHALLIVRDKEQRRRLKEFHKRIFTFDELLNRVCATIPRTNVFLDDADDFIRMFLHSHVLDGISITSDEHALVQIAKPEVVDDV